MRLANRTDLARPGCGEQPTDRDDLVYCAAAPGAVGAGERGSARLAACRADVGYARMPELLRLVSGWRGEPRNAAPDEHDEIGWFTADELGALRLADARSVPLLTVLLRPALSIA